MDTATSDAPPVVAGVVDCDVLVVTTINVTDGLLKVVAEHDNGCAGAEQAGRQAVAAATTAGPLR